MHLGRVGELSLDEARRLCREARGKAKQGEDPRARAPTRSDNFAAAVESYILHEQKGRSGNTSADETKAVMLRNCAEWLRRAVATIRQQEIDALLEQVRDGDPTKELKGRPYLANRLYA